MFTLLIPVLIAAFLVTRIARRLTRPFRPYGTRYNPYGYTRRRRHGFGGGILTILGLVALDHLFHNRRP